LGPPPPDGATGPLCKEDGERMGERHVDTVMDAEEAPNETR